MAAVLTAFGLLAAACGGGGGDSDTLSGGGRGDRLDGGRDSDSLFGGRGADLFVIGHDDAVDTVFDFNYREGDQIRIELPDAIGGPDGEVVGDLLRLSSNLLGVHLQVDRDYDASNGFQAKTVAYIMGAQGASLGGLIDNDII